MWVSADSDAGDPQPPLIPDDSYLSLTSDSGLPMDIANGFDLSLGFLNLGINSTDGDRFDLGFNGPSLPKKWLHLQSIATIKETENLWIKF